ncbi:hypothetical protein [Jeotgalibacillus soli]|uniref:hypothetical protein n=1 Tax=Jeotgalibacillus soli TaxID=889306 RepID=UPI001F2F1C45|nr:hypothetical protein [Jeotgalibacillus soli]
MLKVFVDCCTQALAFRFSQQESRTFAPINAVQKSTMGYNIAYQIKIIPYN